MPDNKKNPLLSDEEVDINSLLSDEEVDISPKPSAPSMQGGESGAVEKTTPSESLLGKDGSLESWTRVANPFQGSKPVDKVENVKIVQPKEGYTPTIQENMNKIQGMTMNVKYPEYSKPSERKEFDFKSASHQVLSEEEKYFKEQSLQRKEQRRIENLPNEIERLRKERADLLLDKSLYARKKLAANEAVTEKMQQDLDNINKSKYESLSNLNQKAVKGVETEVNEYLNDNPKLRDEIKVKGLTDVETYDLVRKSVAKKIAPLEQDLQTFKEEGTIDAASQKIKISQKLQSKQTELESLANQMKFFQDSYLSKNGFSGLNKQLEESSGRLKSYEPYLSKAKSEAKMYENELNQLKQKLESYQSKISGNTFNGTQQEFDDLKALEKEYNETINDINNIYKSESFNGYEDAVSNYNSLLAKRNSLVSGLNSNEYLSIKNKYDAALTEYNLLLEDYKKFEEPEIKDRINKYFSTIQQIGEYDKKVKTSKGELALPVFIVTGKQIGRAHV